MMPRQTAKGFTLIESIVVLVVLAIAAATVTFMIGNISGGQDENKSWQVGLQLMQECAEQVLAQHRANPAVTPACGGLTGYAGVAAPAASAAAHTGAACPAGKTCQLVTITAAVDGTDLTPLRLLLVNP